MLKFFLLSLKTGVLVDISGAITRCREIVDDDADITLDVVFVQFAKLDFWSTNKKQKPYDVAQRSVKTFIPSSNYIPPLNSLTNLFFLE